MRRALVRSGLLCVCLSWCGIPAAAGPPAKGGVDAATKKLMAANGFFKQGMFSVAADEYADFLKKYRTDKNVPAARYGLAVCRYRMGQYAEAAKLLDVVLQDKGLKKQDEALVVLGHCRLSSKEYVQALAAFEKLLADHPKSVHVEFSEVCRLQALYMLGKTKEAAAAARAFLKARPASGHRASVEYYLSLSLARMGDHGPAAETLTGLLKKYPNSPYTLDATLLLGQCLENQSKLDAAAEQYRAMLKLAPPERKSEAHYSLGVLLYKAGKYPEAIKELATVASKFATSTYAAPAKLHLGLAQLAAGKTAEARRTLSDVAKKDKSRAAMATYGIAQCDMSDKKYESARTALDRLAKLDPPMPNLEAIAYDRAVCASATAKYAQAADEFAAFRKQYPKSELVADATYRQGFCLHKLGKYAESLVLCRQAAAAKPSAVVARAAAELAAENLFLMAKYREADAELKQLVQTTGDELAKLRLQLRRAQCAYFTGNFPAAIAVLKTLSASKQVSKDPVLREAIFLLGDAQLQTKRYKEAAKALKRYLSLGTKRKAEAKYKLALAQLRSGQARPAKTVLVEVMQGPADSPWVIRATFEYGQLLYNEGDRAKAAEALTKVLAATTAGQAGGATQDLVAPATYLLAWIDMDAKKYDAAAKRFSEVRQKHAQHPLAAEAHFQHAVCLKELGRPEEALRALGAYLSAQPAGRNALDARRLIGSCLAGTGKHAEAVKLFTELAAEKNTCSDTVLYELAWSHRELKAPAAAMKAYRKLLADYPKSKLATNARAELAELLDIAKNYAEAADLLKKVVADTTAGPKTLSVSLYRLGLCHEKLKKHAEAAAAFSQFAAKYPADENVPSALYQAGAAYATLGRLEDAQKHLGALLRKYPDHELNAVASLKLGEVQAGAAAYDKSAATYTAFLKKHPKNSYAYLARFGMGWSLENRKQYDEARKWYAQVIETHNGPTAARAQFQIGECHFAEGKFDLAVKELLKVDIVYAYPQWSAPALYDAGRAFEQLKKLDHAKRQYALCVKKYKDTEPAKLAAKRLKALESSPP